MSVPGRALLFLSVLLAGGCASQSMQVVSTKPFERQQTTLLLGSMVFDPAHAYSGDMREIRRLCHGIAKIHGFTIIDDGARLEGGPSEARESSAQGHAEGPPLPVIHFYLRDRLYTREFLTLHSIAVFSEIVAPSGTSLYKTYYLEDGPDSLQSLRFLTEIFETTFRALAARIRAEDRELQKKLRGKGKLEEE